MAEIIFTFMLFTAITVIAAVVFGGWVIFSVFRAIFSVLFSIGGGSRRVRRRMIIRNPALMTRTCPNSRCLGANPIDARFCRRCGQPLPHAHRVRMRQAALW